jgi:perosamine synthetase
MAETTIGIADTSLTEAEIEAAIAVLRSGNLRQGPQCQAFEEAFAGKTGAAHALTCANGSAALHIALACFLQPGQEVLVPSFTFVSTATMVIAAGGVPVLCDVDPETWTIDLDDAAGRVTNKTAGIIPVHLFGNVCDIDAIRTFADRNELKIVWDAAQAHGATWDGRDVGTFADYVTYSFYPSKNMFVGEGGMVCTPEEYCGERMKLIREHGMASRYYHTEFGYNYRMTDIAAAIGLAQLSRLDQMIDQRRRNAAALMKGLRGIQGLTLPTIPAKAESAWHQFCVLVDEEDFGMNRDRLAAALKERGIGTAVHYPRGLHQQPVLIERFGTQHLEVTETLARQILALPVHHGIDEAACAKVVDAVRDVAKG